MQYENKNEGKTLADYDLAGRFLFVGVDMKTDRYLAELEKITAQAVTKWDMEKMVEAMAEARANIARRCEAIKRAEFAQRSGMTK